MPPPNPAAALLCATLLLLLSLGFTVGGLLLLAFTLVFFFFINVPVVLWQVFTSVLLSVPFYIVATGLHFVATATLGSGPDVR